MGVKLNSVRVYVAQNLMIDLYGLKKNPCNHESLCEDYHKLVLRSVSKTELEKLDKKTYII